ncbi:serine-rich adhesin for platelets-like [Macrobrachium rosenbergii]|uniref:serine-rich adhesin for platelets-like n=1 Tax=Macrobrachium rosenbergii TaxID=79674 RepID=UPI0034D5B408
MDRRGLEHQLEAQRPSQSSGTQRQRGRKRSGTVSSEEKDQIQENVESHVFPEEGPRQASGDSASVPVSRERVIKISRGPHHQAMFPTPQNFSLAERKERGSSVPLSPQVVTDKGWQFSAATGKATGIVGTYRKLYDSSSHMPTTQDESTKNILPWQGNESSEFRGVPLDLTKASKNVSKFDDHKGKGFVNKLRSRKAKVIPENVAAAQSAAAPSSSTSSISSPALFEHPSSSSASASPTTSTSPTSPTSPTSKKSTLFSFFLSQNRYSVTTSVSPTSLTASPTSISPAVQFESPSSHEFSENPTASSAKLATQNPLLPSAQSSVSSYSPTSQKDTGSPKFVKRLRKMLRSQRNLKKTSGTHDVPSEAFTTPLGSLDTAGIGGPISPENIGVLDTEDQSKLSTRDPSELSVLGHDALFPGDRHSLPARDCHLPSTRDSGEPSLDPFGLSPRDQYSLSPVPHGLPLASYTEPSPGTHTKVFYYESSSGDSGGHSSKAIAKVKGKKGKKIQGFEVHKESECHPSVHLAQPEHAVYQPSENLSIRERNVGFTETPRASTSRTSRRSASGKSKNASVSRKPETKAASPSSETASPSSEAASPRSEAASPRSEAASLISEAASSWSEAASSWSEAASSWSEAASPRSEAASSPSLSPGQQSFGQAISPPLDNPTPLSLFARVTDLAQYQQTPKSSIVYEDEMKTPEKSTVHMLASESSDSSGIVKPKTLQFSDSRQLAPFSPVQHGTSFPEPRQIITLENQSHRSQACQTGPQVFQRRLGQPSQSYHGVAAEQEVPVQDQIENLTAGISGHKETHGAYSSVPPFTQPHLSMQPSRQHRGLTTPKSSFPLISSQTFQQEGYAVSTQEYSSASSMQKFDEVSFSSSSYETSPLDLSSPLRHRQSQQPETSVRQRLPVTAASQPSHSVRPPVLQQRGGSYSESQYSRVSPKDDSLLHRMQEMPDPSRPSHEPSDSYQPSSSGQQSHVVTPSKQASRLGKLRKFLSENQSSNQSLEEQNPVLNPLLGRPRYRRVDTDEGMAVLMAQQLAIQSPRKQASQDRERLDFSSGQFSTPNPVVGTAAGIQEASASSNLTPTMHQSSSAEQPFPVRSQTKPPSHRYQRHKSRSKGRGSSVARAIARRQAASQQTLEESELDLRQKRDQQRGASK